MASDVIGLATVVEPRHERAVIAGADLAVMKANLVSEGAGFPAFHSRSGNGDPINGPAFDGDVSADGFKTLPAEYLTGSGNMFQIGGTVRVGVLSRVDPNLPQKEYRSRQGGSSRRTCQGEIHNNPDQK